MEENKVSCQGKPLEMRDLRTEGQKNVMARLAPLFLAGIQQGATPFPGMLSQPPDPSMLNAMNMMSQVGGQGPYMFPGFQSGAYPMPGQVNFNNPPPLNNPGGGGGASLPGEENRQGNFVPYDPYAPWRTPIAPPNRPPFLKP